jgi:predicted esterase
MPLASVENLAQVLKAGGAEVDLNWQPADHRLTTNDLTAAQAWIARQSVQSGVS